MHKLIRALTTVLSLGLNLVIERMGLNPRWRYLVWGLIAINEIRGIAVVWQVGRIPLRAVGWPV